MTRAIALALTVLTGFSGLVYEVAWQKYLATLLGSHSEATAAVLAVFLGGLAVGYAVFGRVTERLALRARERGVPAPLLGVYGAVEAGIGLYALAFPFVFTLAEAASYLVPARWEGVSFAFDILLAVALIGPPTVLMGGTIPILTQALSGRLEEATRVHAWVYAFNTLGAFAGALAGGFVLVPWLGLDGVLWAMGTVNLVAGAVFLGLQRLQRGGEVAVAPSSTTPVVAGTRFLAFGLVALLGGFAMMAIQTALNRVGGLAFGASHFTFAMIVAVFVLCIALGSFAVSALSRIPPGLIVASQWLLVALLAGVYFVLGDAPYWTHALRALFRDVDTAFYPYHGMAFLGILALLVVPIGLSGALLPLLFHHLRHEMGDLGAVAGRLYSWNTVGSLLGALVGGYVLLFWLDLHHVYRVALAALAVGAGVLTAVVLRARLAAAVLVAAALVGIAVLPPWQPERIAIGLFRNRAPNPVTFQGPERFFRNLPMLGRIIYHDDDPAVTVTVIEARRGGLRSLSIATNGKSDGNLHGDYRTMALAGLLPALFARDPGSTFVIGWGTGVTAGELASLDEVKEVRVAEISPGVLDAAPMFDYGNLDASRSDKVHTFRSDAYRALLRSEGRFGVIASEPSNPWMAGVEMLFSRDFLEAARDRLADGGVYAQWFHLYEVDRETVELVLRTYASVFDDVSIWFTAGDDIIVLGFKDPGLALDLERIERRFERPDFRAGFERSGIRSLDELFAHELFPLGAVHGAGLTGPIHTLRHPILSHKASRAFFLGQRAELPRLSGAESARSGARNSLFRRARAGTPLDEAGYQALADQVCLLRRPVECAAVLAAWRRDLPDSVALEAVLASARLDPEMAAHLAPETLVTLARFWDPGAISRAPMSADPLAEAVAHAGLYHRYYHHAVPFDPKALARIWSRCSSRSPGLVDACQRARARSEAGS